MTEKKFQEKDIDKMMQISEQLYEQLYKMGISWTEAEMIWLNLGSLIFSEGSTLPIQEAVEKMKKCCDGWFNS